MSPFPGFNLVERFEKLIIGLLQLLLVIVIAVATAQLFLLLFQRLPESWNAIDNTDDLHKTLQRAFGGVLIVVLGLELVETLKVYHSEHKVRLEVIMTVSLIAVGRHVIQVDYAHLEGIQLIGMGALILALAGGYYLISRSHQGPSKDG